MPYEIRSIVDFDQQLEDAGDQLEISVAQEIRTIPTFRFFMNKQRLDDDLGANLAGIEFHGSEERAHRNGVMCNITNISY
ncbi:18766_t:CDS:2 [Gigaspora margarita]|uniref:18766_t:CDS:1 n=1 Tax=Gigaspora margarita TaxID=4874 RepID=A0ABN7V1T7_GIGMA|nr:18766_t:CDS:2 [Gigaspora margarita]